MNTIDSLRMVLQYAMGQLGIVYESSDPDIAVIAQMIADYDALAPDWNNAPTWAQWSVIHANGLRYWMEKEPSFQNGDTSWDCDGGKQEFDDELYLRLGIDWRLCIWQRPEVTR